MFGASRKLQGCWLKSLGVLLLICTCLLVPSESYGNPPVPPKQTDSPNNQVATGNKPTQAKQRDTKQAPPIVKVVPASKSDKKPEQVTQQNDSHPTPDWWLIGITFLLVIVTGGLVYYARDTARRQLRAYVSVHRAEITGINGMQTPVATIVIKNYGQTPAYGVTHMGGIALGDSFDTLPIPTGPKEMTNASLPPGEHNDTFQSAPRPLSIVESAALRAGTKTLWAYGEIRYRDAFKIERFTKYRFMIGGHVGVGSNRMAICEEGNEEN